MSGADMFCLFLIRLKIAKKVSNIGMANIKTGNRKLKIATLLKKPITDKIEIIYPRNNAPVSPMKILAG